MLGVRRIPWHLIALLVASSLIWAFVQLADKVSGGGTEAFDAAILLAFRNPADPSDPIGPGWVEEMLRDFTALGGVGVLTLLVLSVSGFVWLRGHRRAVWFLLASVVTGILVSKTLKAFFDRPRPDLVPHESIVNTASFPSGHSLMSAVVYLTLGVMIARTSNSRALKAYIMSIAIALAVTVGISRVYLGVHWPTDVLAGWIVGASWALLCWAVAQWLEARHSIEPEGRLDPR